MTEAQEEAFAKIEEIMREHFDAAVLTVDVEVEDRRHEVKSTWHGGYATAIGLLELGKLHVWHKQEPEAE